MCTARRTGPEDCSPQSRRSRRRSVSSFTTGGSCARRGRCDENEIDPGDSDGDRRRFERLRLSGVFWGAGDRNDRRREARRPGAAGHHPGGAGWVPGLLPLSPQTGEAQRRRRARRRVAGASKTSEIMMTQWLGMQPVAATHGAQIDNLIGWIHIFMLILFVGWGLFLVYAIARFRKSRNPVADYKGVTSKNSTYAEIGVAVIEAVLLIGFAIPLWAARVDSIPPANQALEVNLTPEQFAWNVRYAGPDGVFGRTDVIHSFNVPEFRVKQDAIPGLTIPIWFIPNVTTAEMRTKTGNPNFQYEIACAQLCGLGHYRMRGFVTVLSAEEFQKWMDDEEAKVKELENAGANPFAQ